MTPPNRTATVSLVPFAPDPAAPVKEISVRISRPEPARLMLEYQVIADPADLKVPGPTVSPQPQPTAGLWRHTCMELFVCSAARGPYLEFNLAPSGEWAAYRFSGYRDGMTLLELVRPPRIELRTEPDRLRVAADLVIPETLGAFELTLGVTAVVEHADGRLAYWALRHPGERPDFHHRDGFGLEI